MSVESKAVEGTGPKGLPLSRGVLYAAVPLVAIVAVAAVLLGSGGGHSSSPAASDVSPVATKPAAIAPAAHPHGTIQNAAAGASASKGASGGAVAGGKAVAVAEVRDPEEAKSFPLPASTHHASATTPAVAGEAAVAPGAASDAQIRKELGEEQQAKAQERAAGQRNL
ncbi:MAG TPA: hypothetical protein VHS55_02925, partial [Solirubrobacteraceae bacterium]|nr:hypothetical protein [Solirubrobacteraceae bacterium]